MKDKIIVKGAREHNLKNIDVEIPRDKFVVITGLSGSGKSTLAFDTIYAEGQRRYVESLSSYARQFLGLMNKPDIDSIDGLSPAISIEQKTTSKNPRSTVGTVTEIYDYLRLLFARVGVSYCPICESAIKPQSAENITKLVMSEVGKKIVILAPIVRGLKGTYEKVFEDLKKEGFSRVRVDGSIYDLETVSDEVKLERYEKHWIEAVVDRIAIKNEDKLRVSDSVEQALKFGKGTMVALDVDEEKRLIEIRDKRLGNREKIKEIERGYGETIYSTFGACPNHPEVVFEELEPRNFSFNAPYGACPTCLGLGEQMEVSPELIIPDESLSIMDGAIAAYGKMDMSWRVQQLNAVAKAYRFDVFTPIKKLDERQKSILLYGTDEPIRGAKWSTGAAMSLQEGWEGIIPQTQRLYKQTESDYRKGVLEKFFVMRPCPTCHGKRLKDTILAVKIDKKSIVDVTDMSIRDAYKFFQELPAKLSEKDMFIARQVLKEVNDRLMFLNNVGLSYLTLSRSAGTLSGGEAQRIRLATQIGSNLTGVLYILDEPSIGLHQRDNMKLIGTLKRLRDIGNTLIVVEHDEDTMMEADYVIDIGPGAGIHGGHIVASGTPKEIANNPLSLTGKYLSGIKKIDVPSKRRVIGNGDNKRFKIGVDTDDVICDGCEFVEYGNENILDWDFRNDLGIKAKDLRLRHNKMFDEKYDKFTILDDAKNYLKKLKEDGHNLFIVTSRDEKYFKGTNEWIKSEFGKDFFDEILFTSRVNGNSKAAAANILELDFMVEDNPEEITGLVFEKRNVLVFDRGWNKKVPEDKFRFRVRGWKDIYDKIFRKSFVNSFIIVKGACENNLKCVDVKLPLGVLCGVSGVSGSGKSTLLNQTVVPLMRKHFGMQVEKVGKNDGMVLPDSVTNFVVIDQDPIGKTPRSNPATYTKIFDDVRFIFSNLKESKARGYGPGRFSFNVPGGRCETCRGDGVIKIEMNFLPDVYVECEDCRGKRYNKDTLSVLYKGKSIADILNLDVEKALAFFENHSSIKRRLQTLYDVGLGYIKLGQPATTLSGGESQRIKLTKELAKFKRGHTVYVLDEPTTGLHFEDVNKLIGVLNRLVDKGNSIFVIEHNLDVLKSCDYIIDMGPEGGDEGGKVIARGTPEEIVKVKGSYTGEFLKELLGK